MPKLILALVISSFALSAPCPGVGTTSPIENSIIKDLSFTKCLDDEDIDFDEENICSCLSKYDLGSEAKKVEPDKDPLKEIGAFAVGRIFEFANLAAELDTLNSAATFSSTLTFSDENSCNLTNIISNLSCKDDSKKMEAIFSSLFSGNENYYMAPRKYEGVESVSARLNEYFETLMSGSTESSVRSKTSCLSPKDSYDVKKYKLKESLTFTNLKNGSLDLADLSIINFLSKSDSRAKELMEKYPENEYFKSPEVFDFVQGKLNQSCVKLNQDLESVICKTDFNQFSKNREDYLFDIVPVDTENENIAQLQKNLNWYCSDSDTKSVDQFIQDDYDVELISRFSKTKIDNGISENLSVLESGICSDICEDPSSPYAVGGCKQKDIEKVYVDLGCDKSLIENISLLGKCKNLNGLREQRAKIKIANILEHRNEVQDDDQLNKGEAHSNESTKKEKKSSLLTTFLAPKSINNISKPEVFATAQDATTSKKMSVRSPDNGESQEVITKAEVNQDDKTISSVNKLTMSKQKTKNDPPRQKSSLSFSSNNSANKGVKSISGSDHSISSSNSARRYRSASTKNKLAKLKDKLNELKVDNRRFEKLIKDSSQKNAKTQVASSLSEKQIKRLTKYDDYGLAVTPANSQMRAGHHQYALSNDPVAPQAQKPLARTDMLGKKATGVSSPEDGDDMIQASFNSVSGNTISSDKKKRAPSSLGKHGKSASGNTSDIAKIFSGDKSLKNINHQVSREVVEVQVPNTLKEVKLDEVLKNRNEIIPGQPFVIYEKYKGRKIKVKLLPTFSYDGTRQIFTGYRAVKTSSNRLLVSKLKAAKNLLIQQ